MYTHRHGNPLTAQWTACTHELARFGLVSSHTTTGVPSRIYPLGRSPEWPKASQIVSLDRFFPGTPALPSPHKPNCHRKSGNIISLIFPRLLALETFVAGTFFLRSSSKKCFWTFFRNILLSQQTFLSRANGETFSCGNITSWCFPNMTNISKF